MLSSISTLSVAVLAACALTVPAATVHTVHTESHSSQNYNIRQCYYNSSKCGHVNATNAVGVPSQSACVQMNPISNRSALCESGCITNGNKSWSGLTNNRSNWTCPQPTLHQWVNFPPPPLQTAFSLLAPGAHACLLRDAILSGDSS